MTELVFYLMLFVAVGAFFLFIHLMIGKFVRPIRPEVDKLTIYECGEPTIGSAWIQFDLRYYVVALLFVIFDVEVAFFFPWALVFGKANALAENTNLEDPVRQQMERQLMPSTLPSLPKEPTVLGPGTAGSIDDKIKPTTAKQLAWLAFWDILVFFGVLLVGFAYLWRRGDIDWVRTTIAEELPPPPPPPMPAAPAPEAVHTEELVGAGHH